MLEIDDENENFDWDMNLLGDGEISGLSLIHI